MGTPTRRRRRLTTAGMWVMALCIASASAYLHLSLTITIALGAVLAMIQLAVVGPPISMLPRWVHRCWARLRGYFWLPCPRCGRMFGGHEWRAHDWITIVEIGKPEPMICPSCTRRNRGRTVDRRTIG